MRLAAALTLVEPCNWRRTRTFLPKIRVNLQIRIHHLEVPEAKVRMLAVAKGPSSTLGSVVGGFPSRVVQEHAQVCKVVRIQMLLLFAEWRELGGCGVLVPGAVALLGFNNRTPLAMLVPPDGEPRLQEAARDAERRSSRAGQQLRERLLFFGFQVIWVAEEEGTVEPQFLAHLANLVPIAPGLRRWLNRRRQLYGFSKRGERRGIRRGELQPTADRVLIDADRAGQGSGGLDLWP